MKRFSESRMREIRTSGSTRGERTAPFVSSVLLLYRETRFSTYPRITAIVDFQKDFAFKSSIYGERHLSPPPAPAKP
jgi:hypothetical protein